MSCPPEWDPKPERPEQVVKPFDKCNAQHPTMNVRCALDNGHDGEHVEQVWELRRIAWCDAPTLEQAMAMLTDPHIPTLRRDA